MEFVSAALNSVLAQTFENWEVLICNDASTDNTKEVIESFRDSRIKIFSNQKNLGPGKTRDFLIKQAQKGRLGDCHASREAPQAA